MKHPPISRAAAGHPVANLSRGARPRGPEQSIVYVKGQAKLPYELVGTSAVVLDCVAQVRLAAADERHVLIAAEAGLDTQAVARAVHRASRRKTRPFLVQPCAGWSAGELERALFGAPHRAGDLETISTTCALARAHGGILLLSDLDELPAPLQRRLARILRDGEVRMVRRSSPASLDVRVVASTNNRLDPGLREDLLRRLPVIVDLPSLRQRRGDVPAVAQAMLAARDHKRRFTAAALTVLAALPWRRNTSELSGLIARLTAPGTATLIRQEDVLAEVQLDRSPARPTGNLRDARRAFEREFIAAVLRDHAWQMRDAARALGIERANLYRKARQLGIPLRRESGAERRVSG
jgi:DNA-binding NtrC family response regulator